MKITRLPSEGGKRVLRVEAAWTDIAADYDAILSGYATMHIPGGRPGMVPRSVIEQRLQKQILDDLSQRAAQRLARAALAEAGAEALGRIEIHDIECAKGQPFRFCARFRPLPEMELPDLRSFALSEDGSDLRDALSHQLLARTSFAVPDDLVQAELGDEEGDKDSDSWSAAQNRVKLMLMLKRIAKQEGIAVSEADVEEHLKEKAIESGIDLDALKRELEKRGEVWQLKDMLLAESTLDYLVEKWREMKDG